MFDRVTIRASDRPASQRFLDAVLPTLGVGTGAGELVVVQATAAEPVTRGLHVGLAAASVEQIDAFWQAGIDAGFTSDGEPGPRPQYTPDYYGAFLLDPDGNSIEAAIHGRVRPVGTIDHVRLRVRNVALTSRFLQATAAQAGDGAEPGFRLVDQLAELDRFRGPVGGSISISAGPEYTVGVDLQIGAARYIDDDGRSLKLRAAGATD